MRVCAWSCAVHKTRKASVARRVNEPLDLRRLVRAVGAIRGLARAVWALRRTGTHQDLTLGMLVAVARTIASRHVRTCRS